jgi:hypothetical protein
VWSIAAVFAASAISYAIWRGSRDGPEKAILWRSIKVWGAVLGIFGLIAAMLALETTVRSFNQDREKYLLERFLYLKFKTIEASAIACSGDQSSQDAENECFDFRNIDNTITTLALALNSHIHFPKIENWRNNSHLLPLLENVNGVIDDMNHTMDYAYEKPLISIENRARLGSLALFLISLALACSTGEAVYQLQQERMRGAARRQGAP